MTDNGFPTQDRCTRVDHHMILDRGVPFHIANNVSICIGWKAECPQRHSLVNFYMISDMRGFPNHNAGPVIDKKVISNRCTGMDIDTCFLVCPF